MKTNIFFICMCGLIFACKKNETTPQKESFSFASFGQSDTGKINVTGAAYFDRINKKLVLNDAVPLPEHQTSTGTGHAYYNRLVDISDGFETSFSFSISDLGGITDGNNNIGGDGISFSIFNSDTSMLKDYTWWPQIKNSITIEFDTYYNGNVDNPNGNHIALYSITDSSLNIPSQISINSSVADFSNEGTHLVKISYLNKNLKVYLDGTLVIDSDVDLANLLTLDNGKGYIVLSSFSGISVETHTINSWSFTPY